MSFEIIHKPTFTNQLLVIPKEQIVQILDKIEVLRLDPKPHGKLKKKLSGYKGDIYRLRSGDYRIIYTYGDGWVALLGVDARKDIYKGDKLYSDELELDVKGLKNLDELLTPDPTPSPPTLSPQPQNLLPVQITEDLLTRLRIPSECFPALLACRTLDDLLEANIAPMVRDRLFDCITSPDFDQVLAQPSFNTGEPSDLLRFKEGELMGFLLKLDPEQERFVTWALNASGPTLLKGGPGTGKSTVALYRAKVVLEALKANGVKEPKILFTTYTNALISFSKQLLESLLGQDIRYAKVDTADSLIYSLICQTHCKPSLTEPAQLRALLKQALPNAIAAIEGNVLQKQAQIQILNRLSLDYLITELDSVIEGRGLRTLEEYQATSRTGREIALNKVQRKAVWHLHEHLGKLLKEQGLETWGQMRNRALDILQTMDNPPIYDAVIIDEAQDLEPNALRFLTLLCRSPNRLFVAADANQSIYGGGFRWGNVHRDLKFTGRTATLRLNHRTTREINEAAHHYLTDGILDDEVVERSYIHSGPAPAVRGISNRADEGALLLQFCRAATREFRLGINACAILVPSERAGTKLAEQLNYLGLETHFMSSQAFDLSRSGVKVLTLKAAKGLEFPVVAIAGFLESGFPIVPKGTLEDEKAEIFARERRTLFVGMTRAMRALLILTPAEKPSVLLQNFSSEHWNLGQPA